MAHPKNAIGSPGMPRMGNALTRGVGRLLLKLMGWRISGSLPDEKKLIIIGGPHTSNLDFVLAMSAMLAVGLRFSYMMKKEAFENPFGGLFKALGGVPIDRADAGDVARQMADWFNANDNVWLGITPEGTRSKVQSFKKGYLHIALASKAPLFIVGINAPTREVVLDRIWPLTGDIDRDNAAIRDYMYSKFTGVNPENQ